MLDIVKVENGDYAEALSRSVTILEQGGVIVAPTDTAYGLTTRADSEESLQKILDIKHRVPDKGLTMLVRDLEHAHQYAEMDARMEQFFAALLPGPVTLLMPAKKDVSGMLTGMYPTVALRIPDYVFTSQLLTMVPYAVTSTSANISGAEYSPDPAEVVAAFAQSDVRPDLMVDAGVLPQNVFSTILDLTTVPYQVTRIGALSEQDLLQRLGNLQ